MTEKISCPKCDHAAGYFRWCVWRDLSGTNKVKCPSCKVLFKLQWQKFRFLNKPFLNILIQVVFGGFLAVPAVLLPLYTAMLFDLSVLNFSLLFICAMAITMFSANQISAWSVNKNSALIEVPEIKESSDGGEEERR
ncbi:MAG: hypothetical protein E2O41_07285 [Nitrospina sp.]|nr:MAG: hypothetical protein E2O41_07285 [Nitrospina sp.]